MGNRCARHRLTGSTVRPQKKDIHVPGFRYGLLGVRNSTAECHDQVSSANPTNSDLVNFLWKTFRENNQWFFPVLVLWRGLLLIESLQFSPLLILLPSMTTERLGRHFEFFISVELYVMMKLTPRLPEVVLDCRDNGRYETHKTL